jgi:hypothetical protein
MPSSIIFGFRATKAFEIHVSMTQLSYGNANWKLFASGTMPQHCTDCDLGYTATGPVLTGQYIKFTVKSYYGVCGGLSYFRPNSDDPNVCVPPLT